MRNVSSITGEILAILLSEVNPSYYLKSDQLHLAIRETTIKSPLSDHNPPVVSGDEMTLELQLQFRIIFLRLSTMSNTKIYLFGYYCSEA